MIEKNNHFIKVLKIAEIVLQKSKSVKHQCKYFYLNLRNNAFVVVDFNTLNFVLQNTIQNI
jgi:hypothetical protein